MSHRKNSSTHPFKAQAKSLRSQLEDLGLSITHSQALEIISKSQGFKDWNTASATVETNTQSFGDLYRRWNTSLGQMVHLIVERNSTAHHDLLHERILHNLRKGRKMLIMDGGVTLATAWWENWTDHPSITHVYNSSVEWALERLPEEAKTHDDIVLLKPGRFQDQGVNLLGKIRQASPGVEILVISSGTKNDAGYGYALGTPDWTRMADVEWFLEEKNGKVRSYLQKEPSNLDDLLCPHCCGRTGTRQGVFFTRSTGAYPALACVNCDAVWDHPHHSFVEATS